MDELGVRFLDEMAHDAGLNAENLTEIIKTMTR
jgi:hypothetical protein